MSTQRREDRGQHTICAEVATKLGHIWLAFIAQFVRTIATVGTAPLPAVKRLSGARLATNSLHPGHLNTKHVRQEISRKSRTWAPIRAEHCVAGGSSATHRSWIKRFSLRLTLAPSVLERLRPSLPHHPAGKCRWTERYDGKRDLYFLNAA
jgi:hypothetical protein